MNSKSITQIPVASIIGFVLIDGDDRNIRSNTHKRLLGYDSVIDRGKPEARCYKLYGEDDTRSFDDGDGGWEAVNVLSLTKWAYDTTLSTADRLRILTDVLKLSDNEMTIAFGQSFKTCPPITVHKSGDGYRVGDGSSRVLIRLARHLLSEVWSDPTLDRTDFVLSLRDIGLSYSPEEIDNLVSEPAVKLAAVVTTEADCRRVAGFANLTQKEGDTLQRALHFESEIQRLRLHEGLTVDRAVAKAAKSTGIGSKSNGYKTKACLAALRTEEFADVYEELKHGRMKFSEAMVKTGTNASSSKVVMRLSTAMIRDIALDRDNKAAASILKGEVAGQSSFVKGGGVAMPLSKVGVTKAQFRKAMAWLVMQVDVEGVNWSELLDNASMEGTDDNPLSPEQEALKKAAVIELTKLIGG